MQLSLVGMQDTAPAPDQADEDHSRRRRQARAAEHLVAADLSIANLDCYFAAEGLPYDLIVDNAFGIWRVQVKSQIGLRTESNGLSVAGSAVVRTGYIFDGRSGSKNRKGLKSYLGQADVLACVAVDLKRVLYVKIHSVPGRLVVKPEGFSEEACALSLRENVVFFGGGHKDRDHF